MLFVRSLKAIIQGDNMSITFLEVCLSNNRVLPFVLILYLDFMCHQYIRLFKCEFWYDCIKQYSFNVEFMPSTDHYVPALFHFYYYR